MSGKRYGKAKLTGLGYPMLGIVGFTSICVEAAGAAACVPWGVFSA